MSGARSRAAPFRGRGERAALAAEIDEEFSFHLELLEQEMRRQGMGAEAARRAALERFGDPVRHRDRCCALVFKERIMLQRVNTGLLVLVLAAGVLMFARMERSQRRQAAEMQAIIGKLETASRPAAQAAQAAPALPRTEQVRSEPVYIGAGVARPGAYIMPEDNYSLRKALIYSGGPVEGAQWSEVVIVRADGQVETLQRDELVNPTGQDLALSPGARVEFR